MRFWAASKLVILKDRTSPARTALGLEETLGPDFHFCASIAESEEMSAFEELADASALFASASLHCAITPSPSSTLARVAETSTTRPLTLSPALCSAMYSSIEVGTSCLIPNRSRRRSRVRLQDLRFDDLPTLSASLG